MRCAALLAFGKPDRHEEKADEAAHRVPRGGLTKGYAAVAWLEEVDQFEGLVPGPVAVRPVRVGAFYRWLLIFEEHSTNKMMPADTGQIVVDSLTYADEDGGEPYFHDQIVYCDDTPGSKV